MTINTESRIDPKTVDWESLMNWEHTANYKLYSLYIGDHYLGSCGNNEEAKSSLVSYYVKDLSGERDG